MLIRRLGCCSSELVFCGWAFISCTLLIFQLSILLFFSSNNQSRQRKLCSSKVWNPEEETWKSDNVCLPYWEILPGSYSGDMDRWRKRDNRQCGKRRCLEACKRGGILNRQLVNYTSREQKQELLLQIWAWKPTTFTADKRYNIYYI